MPSPEWVTTSDGASLALRHFQPAGSGGPSVLLTHGTFSDASVCALLARDLSAAGFDCWVLELRGHGASTTGPTEPTFDRISREDVPTALDAVRERTGGARPFWVAHSGGALVLLMHLARNSAAASLLSGVVGLGAQATEAAASALGRVKVAASAAVTHALRRAPGRALGLGPQDEFLGVMAQWYRWNWTRRWLGQDGFDYLEALQRVEVPTLLMAGAGDDFIAPPAGCERLFKTLGATDKTYLVCGTATGYSEDFNHARLIASRAARRELYPVIRDWLKQRSP